jgi:hypothetical protein
MFFQNTIMRNMYSTHDEAMISHPRGVFLARMRGAMNGRRLPNDDVITDDELPRFQIRSQMLRRKPDKRRRPNLALPANDGVPLNMCLFMNDRARADPHRAFDNAIAADGDPIIELCPWVDQGRWMYVNHHISP